jgi:hypothetical protein
MKAYLEVFLQYPWILAQSLVGEDMDIMYMKHSITSCVTLSPFRGLATAFPSPSHCKAWG